MKHQNVKNSTNGLLSLLINIFFCSSLFWALSPWLHSQEALPHFSSPAIITSAGQSAEVQLAAVIAKRAGLEATLIKMATPADLKGTKTLILVLGASLKGLGAAGLDMNQEIDRVKSLLQACQEKRYPLFASIWGANQGGGNFRIKSSIFSFLRQT